MGAPKDVDGIRQAWEQVANEHGVTPEQVSRIHSTWGASTLDKRYVELTFPNAETTAAFPRPTPDGWDEAFASAKQVMDELLEEELQQATHGILESTQDGILLPLLRSASLPDSEQIRESLAHFFLIPDRVYTTFARMGPTPRGTIGMLHLMHSSIQGPDDFTKQVDEALDSMAKGLVGELYADDESEVIVVNRKDKLPVASALCLDGFHDWISGIQGWQDLTVAIPCPDQMIVTPTGTAYAETLRREVAEADGDPQMELLPSLFRVTADSMELVAEGSFIT